jgi:hypothetical protein
LFIIYKFPELIKSKLSSISGDYDPAMDVKSDLEKKQTPRTHSEFNTDYVRSKSDRESATVGDGLHRKHMSWLTNSKYYMPDYCSPIVSNI